MLNTNEHKCIMLINIKMPSIVDILTFISMIDTSSESLEARKILNCQHFSFMTIRKFLLS